MTAPEKPSSPHARNLLPETFRQKQTLTYMRAKAFVGAIAKDYFSVYPYVKNVRVCELKVCESMELLNVQGKRE